MSRKVSLRLVGAIVAPAVIVAFILGMILSGVLNLAPRPVQAQAEFLPNEASPFVAAVEKVIPTVVNISAEKVVKRSERSLEPDFGGPFEELFRDFFKGFPELPFEVPANALGSGVIIRPDGYIVTNNHVVAGYDRFVVKLADGTEFKGSDVKVVGRDPQTDLAVIKVNTKRALPTISYADPASIRVGDWAIAVGNPYGLQSTVTVGVISAKGRTGIPLPEGPSRQDFIQTDASINPGNSGGALANVRGELIGINTAIRSPVGASVGIGFAVPVSFVKTVAEQLIEHGKVVRGYLGIAPQPVTEAIRQALKLEDTKGVLVSQVLDKTPAAEAGLREGDVIVQVNGVKTEGVEQFREQIAGFRPGTQVTLGLVRDGKRLSKTVTLAEFPEEAQAVVPVEKEKSWLGIEVRDLTGAERRQAGVDNGVIIEHVDSGSPAAEAGLASGDIILKIGDRKVKDEADYRQITRELADTDEPVLFYVKRGRQRLFIAVEPGD
ncbi:MAG: Do family serine endopeptidase [candidate division WOR-3 bacterium]